jgi:hypothetical protein
MDRVAVPSIDSTWYLALPPSVTSPPRHWRWGWLILGLSRSPGLSCGVGPVIVVSTRGSVTSLGVYLVSAIFLVVRLQGLERLCRNVVNLSCVGLHRVWCPGLVCGRISGTSCSATIPPTVSSCSGFMQGTSQSLRRPIILMGTYAVGP